MPSSTRLSKSTFIRSLQCQKSLYLYKNHYNRRDIISYEQQAVFDRGHRVGALAWQLFPDGTDAGWDSPKEFQKSVDLTQALIRKETPMIYEAAFLWNDVLVAADILVKEEKGWHIYEVKSSLSVSETYLRDAALQYYIISKTGLPLTGISIVHLNRDFEREAELDVHKLFIKENVTAVAEQRIPGVIEGLIKARKTLLNNAIPEIKIGPHCTLPYDCDFRNFCGWNTLPVDSVFGLAELEETQKWVLFQNDTVRFHDIPDDFELSDKQKIEIESKRSGRVYIDREKIASFFTSVEEPIAFLDIKTFRPAIPEVLGARPYQRIPYGFAIKEPAPDSLIQTFVSDADLNMEQTFLQEFADAATGYKTLVVYDMQDEISALKTLAGKYPEIEPVINIILDSCIDISAPFFEKHFYHPATNGYLPVVDLPAVFGQEHERRNSVIGSSSHAGTAFGYLFGETDLFKAKEVKTLISNYMRDNVDAMELVYSSLVELART